MKTLLINCLILVAICTAERDCGEETIRERCTMTNRDQYLRCVKETSLNCRSSCEDATDCYDSCDSCDCNYCHSCSSYCDTCCQSCCQTRKRCRTESCCRRECNTNNHCSSNRCRESCHRDCSERSSPRTSSNRTSSTGNTQFNVNKNLENHTSVIHLNNFVNTKNVIATPVDADAASLNRIYPSNSWGVEVPAPDAGNVTAPQKNCCRVLSPRQCASTHTFPFVRCWHYSYKMCGHMCYAPVMHTYHQQQCQQGFCQQMPVYVPQPSPGCAHNQNWPYVSCGRPQGVNCEGCYGHHFGQARISCSPFCYDDGYGVGPYYRQGPFYQPWYSPVPSCRVTVTCEPFGNFYGYQENVFGNYVPGFSAGPFPAGNPISPDIYTVDIPDPYPTSTMVPVINQTDHSTTTANVSNIVSAQKWFHDFKYSGNNVDAKHRT